MKRKRAWTIALGVGLSTTSIATAWSTRASADKAVVAPETLADLDVSVEPNPTLSVQTDAQHSPPLTIVRYVDVYVYDDKTVDRANPETNRETNPEANPEANPADIASGDSHTLTTTKAPAPRKKARKTVVRAARVRAQARVPAAPARSDDDHESDGGNDD